jgi:hypothetical protein
MKGSITDLVYVLILIFVFGFVAIIANMIYDKYTEQTALNPAFNTPQNTEIETNAQTLLTNFDYIYVFFIVAMAIIAIASSFWIKTHPIFFFVSIFMLIISIILAAMFGNIFSKAAENDLLSVSVAEYTIIPFVMAHLPTIILLIGALLLVILYAKDRLE